MLRISSDILDDDSTEFLEALKRQMEGTNILNASPREVLFVNRIPFCSMTLCSLHRAFGDLKRLFLLPVGVCFRSRIALRDSS